MDFNTLGWSTSGDYPRRQTYRLNSSSEGTYARVPIHSRFRGRIIHHFLRLREVPTQGFSYEISGILLAVSVGPEAVFYFSGMVLDVLQLRCMLTQLQDMLCCQIHQVPAQ